MKEAFDLVREGMKVGGVPPALIKMSEEPLTNTEIQTKITLAYKVMTGKSLLIVLGPESPLKDLVCVKLMRKFMLDKNKNGLWLSPGKVPSSYSDGQIPNHGITVITGMELLTPFQLTAVRQLLRDRLPHGAIFIMTAWHEKQFKGLIGNDAMEYFSHFAVMLEVPSAKAEILKV